MPGFASANNLVTKRCPSDTRSTSMAIESIACSIRSSRAECRDVAPGELPRRYDRRTGHTRLARQCRKRWSHWSHLNVCAGAALHHGFPYGANVGQVTGPSCLRCGNREGERCTSARIRNDGGAKDECIELVIRVCVRVSHHFQSAESADRRTEDHVARPMVVVVYA